MSAKKGSKKPSKTTSAEKDSATTRETQDIEVQESGISDDSTEVEDGGSDLNVMAAETDYQLRVAELATQLYCAQLSAEASKEAARSTVSGIQRIAAAFVMASARISSNLETLGNKTELIDSGIVDRAHGDLLRAAEGQELPLHKATPLNDPDHDALFEGAFSRAQRLLTMRSKDTSQVYAEQLFSADEALSESEVGKRFKKCKWPVLKNRETFYDYIILVEKWYHDRLAQVRFPEDINPLTK